MSRKINEAGLEIIKSSEGLRLRAYLCPSKIWTIGYGRAHGVKEDDVISPEQAEKMLKEDLRWAESAVEKYTNVPLTDNQFSALVSLVFNIGTGNYLKSPVLEHLKASKYMEAAEAFMAHVYASGGVAMKGLEIRRKREADLFLTGIGVLEYT